jgi:2-oxoglutarate dehydrogenase E2 component (dihydrolipoamide succinyltransferase)
MAVDIIVPAAGESVTEAEIAHWHKEDGDVVELDEVLVELETEKATQEVCAEVAGKLSIQVEAGETVKVGQVIGSLDETAAEDSAESKASAPAPAAAPEPEPVPAKEPAAKAPETPEPEAAIEEEPHEEPVSHKLHDSGSVKKVPSPAARRLMVLNNISSQDVYGSGRDGRITKGDVLRYLRLREKQLRVSSTVSLKPDEAKAEQTKKDAEIKKAVAAEKRDAKPSLAKTPEAGQPGIRVERMSMIRRTIANRLVEAQQTAAILTTFNEVDMSQVMALRKSYKEAFKEKYQVNLGFMSFFAKAVTIALKEFPAVNAQIRGDDVIYHDYVSLGVAVSTPKGLTVPVVRNVQDLSFPEIEREIVRLAVKGRDGAIAMEDMAGGTFTITNGGTFGSMLSTPILNRPQSGILGMHNIVERPWVVDGEIVIRPIMYVALSYDHRLIDGAQAVRFLVTIKECIEDPSRIMLEI